VLPPPEAKEKFDLESEVQGVFNLELEDSVIVNNSGIGCDIQTEMTPTIEEETEKKTEMELDLNSSTKEKEEVSPLIEKLVSARVINLKPSSNIIHTDSITEERQRKQEITVDKSSSPSQDARSLPLPKPPDAVPSSKELSDPPSPEPPPDSDHPVTTVPRRAPPDLQDSFDRVVYTLLSAKKRGKVQMSLGRPPSKLLEPPYTGYNSVNERV